MTAEKLRDLFSIEAEESLLGSVLIDPDVWPLLKVQTSHFHIHKHRFIWEAFLSLESRRSAIDVVTVANELEKNGILAQIGGSAFLTALTQRTPSSINAEHYAAIVSDYARRRQDVLIADMIVKGAHNGGVDRTKVIDLLSNNAGPEVTADPAQCTTWADIDAGPIEYSWGGWLVNGLLTLLVGYSGDGKSLLALRMCGPFIAGESWPDGTRYTGEKGKVLWVECEAAQALNVLRANVFKYPLDRIMTALPDPLQDASLDNLEHRAIIEQRAKLPEVKLIVIDSLSGSSQRKENETGIKEITLWAAKLARDLNKPVLMVHHLGKKKEWDSETITLDRVRGSSAIVQFARVVWAVSCPDATNKERKRLEQIKNNLGRFPEAIGMTATEQGIDFGIAPTVPRADGPSDRVGDLLLDVLASGPMKATDIQTEIEGAGESMVTAKRVKARLGIVSVKKEDGWYWSLPARDNGHA